MSRSNIIVSFLFLAIAHTAFGQTDSIRRYVKSALDIMKAKSVNRSKVNWDSLYTVSIRSASACKTIRDTYPVITDALKGLQDSHSRFYAPEVVKDYVLGYRATGQEFPVIRSDFLENKYAYIALPEIGCYNFDDWNEYVNTFYTKLAALEQQHPEGWILDIRGNIGGMFYPMYAAIAPLLDRQKVIGTKDANGKITYFGYKRARLYEGKDAIHQFRLEEKMPKLKRKPLVILVDKKTGSSGEFSAISFVGQENVSFIGENTQGLTSGNQEYQLGDGAFLVITTGNTVDRNLKEYDKVGEGLAPDVRIQKMAKQAETDKLYMTKALEVLDKM